MLIRIVLHSGEFLEFTALAEDTLAKIAAINARGLVYQRGVVTTFVPVSQIRVVEVESDPGDEPGGLSQLTPEELTLSPPTIDVRVMGGPP